MNTASSGQFDRHYQTHLQHLKLKGLQPKTIEAYSRAIRRVGDYFDHQIDNLSVTQLTDYFSDLVATHSWSTVKLDLYGLKFYYDHVLRQPWVAPGLIKPPKSQRLATLINTFSADFLTQYSSRLLPEHLQAMAAIKRCRTESSLKMQVPDCRGAGTLIV